MIRFVGISFAINIKFRDIDQKHSGCSVRLKDLPFHLKLKTQFRLPLPYKVKKIYFKFLYSNNDFFFRLFE